MPIRIPAARLQAACCRPSAIPSRALLGTVPPRTTRIHARVQLSAQSLLLRKMSTRTSDSKAGFSPATTTTTTTAAATSGNRTGSPARESSTPPRPGNSPSAASAATAADTCSGSGSDSSADSTGGAAPAPAPPSQRSETTVDATTNNDTTTTPTPFPALPEPPQEPDAGPTSPTTTVRVNGQAVALDALGPMVVNRDGTVSRIGNWHEMTAIERQNTLRILGKRNQLRLGNLRAGLPADQAPGSGAGSGSGSGVGSGE
ncbi:hypothetical protein B0I37DRAFT_373662 [Chaetomium sp. MPI-CAGE-AT-0009]|nr:hypothetical protein B0I37DRAFT_373662 [Chaetomium sp. MPI-CAGE-AT-0009]